jgi:septum formation protein
MILASASPRRADLLREEGFQLDIRPAGIDERRLVDEIPTDYVERLAIQKAQTTHKSSQDNVSEPLLVAADTIVWTDDGLTLGKPADADDARNMLRRLSGTTHHVSTGVCLLVCGNPLPSCVAQSSFCETTDVSFFELSDELIEWYISTGEPFDKAGSYGIQGRGRRLVKGIRGDFYNVVGLPIARLMKHLDEVQRSLADSSHYWF